MNSYFYKYLYFEKQIDYFIFSNKNEFYKLPEKYNIKVERKDKNTINIQIKWNYNYKINIKNIPLDINNIIQNYLNYTILFTVELEFYIDKFFQIYMQWKFIDYYHNNTNNILEEQTFYKNIIKYRNIINRRRFQSKDKYIYTHSIQNEFISFIADINEFEFITNKFNL